MTADPSHWSNYWADADGCAALTAGAPGQRLAAFWRDRVTDALSGQSHSRVIDLACGAGAILRYVSPVLKGRESVHFVAADISPPALMTARQTFPGVGADFVVSDASRPPFVERQFSFVMSQFGLEYAGLGAFARAAALVDDTGRIAAIVHLKGGAIERECADNLCALEGVIESGLLECAAGLVRQAHRAPDGGAVSAEVFADSGGQAQQAAQRGRGAAGEFLRRLIADTGQLTARAHAYALADAEHWLSHQSAALQAYAGRMRAMTGAALDQTAVADIIGRFEAEGLTARAPETLVLVEGGDPAAWILEASRAGG